MVRFCLQEGDLFIHNTNSVFTALPFTMVALQDPASEFALRKLSWRVRDEGPLQYVSEQFENIGHSSHCLSFLFHEAKTPLFGQVFSCRTRKFTPRGHLPAAKVS
jgi:hypothetical protein